MDKFLTGVKRKVEDVPTAHTSRSSVVKQKSRKYDESYLCFGFTSVVINNEERPQCVLCLTTLASESMKPNKLKRHLETKHSEVKNKPEEYFRRKLNEIRIQQKSFINTTTTTVASKALLASYQVSYRIAQNKKPHTVAETLILPAAIDMVQTMLGEKCAQQLRNIPLSNNTVSRRIADISYDLEEQLIEKLRDNRFAIQLDEATDCSGVGHLIAYVRFVEDTTINENMLFCKPIKGRAIASELFKIVDDFMKEKNVKWSDCVGICTDAARVMAGNKEGLQALIKRSAPEAMWTHCMIHRESLATKELCTELSEVMDVVIKTVNYIKTRPLKSRLFAQLCEEMGAQYKSLLFYCNSRWLSRGNVVARIYNLREEIGLFLEEENVVHAEHFRNENFLCKLAYLGDIFEKFNTLNTSMQGNNTNIIVVTDKVKAFIGKLGLWVRKLEEKSLDMFSRLKDFVDKNNVDTSDTGIDQCVKAHLVNLQSGFSKYFPEAISDKYKWITDPFLTDSSKNYNFSLEEEENYIDIISDTSLKVQFPRKSYIEFWVDIGEEFPHISKKALNILLPFATSYLCETGFSAVAAIKTKYRSMMNLENELRVAISKTEPRYEKLCAERQAHPSH